MTSRPPETAAAGTTPPASGCLNRRAGLNPSPAAGPVQDAAEAPPASAAARSASPPYTVPGPAPSPSSPSGAGEGVSASPPEPSSGAGSGGETSAPGKESRPAQAAFPGAATGREWVIELPAGLRLLSLNDRIHWTQRYEASEALKDAAVVMCRRAKVPRLRRVRVTVVYDPPPVRRWRDADNIAQSAKPLIDGMRISGVVPDDNSQHVLAVTCMIGAEPFPRGRLRMIITDMGAAA